ncbi:hypothetical protein RHMOL_Rhmol13G0188800 [Rhododendron molle]|uniref:Uncharacterized protein n=1 Tax=Rhododendron molle TaxID=49168 RepID=A0ACC0L9D3_RHOML|nr:hypothetical protein RHMOL_Rhmol13G0188800 [Rhododendron molle]
MDIPEKLLQYKYHIVMTFVFLLIAGGFILIAPRLFIVLSYFWPLFLSTAVFLAAVTMFGQTSVWSAESYGDKEGEELLDYVTGRPEQLNGY